MLGFRFARRTAPALFLVAFLAACSGSSKQPPLRPEGVEERLNATVPQIKATETSTEVTVKADGPAKVEAKDDGTVVGTFPRITVTGKEGETATLDNVTLRFMPGDEGQTPFEATVPNTFTVKDKDGKVVGEAK